tara:strand:+ start:49 stop:291 length:243 start_codon:yes stop_codon:yes gene_type:complete
MDKTSFFSEILEQRNKDIEMYQINIDNYQMAIDKIDNSYSEKEGMDEFKNQLIELLRTSKIEQLKEIIMRDVIEEQLNKL